MKSKITIKDIAREAGVSVATVSYILNERPDQKISDTTKNKVLQIVNLFGYTGNQSARTLATGKSNNIAVYVSKTESLATDKASLQFLDALSLVLSANKQSLIYTNTDNIERQTNTDAIICLNLDRELFYKIGNNNFVPLIAVNTFINDPLFFQINNDYPSIYQTAANHFLNDDFIFFCQDITSKLLKEYIRSVFPKTYFSSSILNDFNFIQSNKHKNFLVICPILYDLFDCKNNVFLYNAFETEQITKVLECIDLAVKHLPIENHNIIV